MNLKNNRLNNQLMASRRSTTIPNPHSFLDCKHLIFIVTHRTISGKTMQCTLCDVLPSRLPGGTIVLESFVGNMFRYEPGLSQEVEGRNNPTIGFVSGWNCMGLSGWCP
jgi:hypothetical protein